MSLTKAYKTRLQRDAELRRLALEGKDVEQLDDEDPLPAGADDATVMARLHRDQRRGQNR